MADEDLELSEVLIVGAIAGGGLLVLVVLGLFGSGQIDVSSWGFTEYATGGIALLIVGSIGLAIILGSDDEGEQGGVFTGWGFPLTIIALLVGLLMVQTNFFGLIPADPTLIDLDGDGNGDIYSDQIPEGYVDYGEPQPYGYGNYGPENEGLLTDGQGCAAGAAAGVATGLALGLSTAPATAFIGVIGGPIIGGALGCAAGFFGSAADFDGDPTTGW
tara:strand:- start:146 stop:796 length:651 start_codon:yes stop_codon:yes gene_type:complete